MRIELSLPDEVYQRAQRLAQVSHRGIAEILVDTLACSLPALEPAESGVALAELSDAEIMALTHLELAPQDDQRFSALLDKQQAGELTDIERTELSSLMQRYQIGLLRKAQALQEAVQRGLRKPLSS